MAWKAALVVSQRRAGATTRGHGLTRHNGKEVQRTESRKVLLLFHSQRVHAHVFNRVTQHDAEQWTRRGHSLVQLRDAVFRRQGLEAALRTCQVHAHLLDDHSMREIVEYDKGSVKKEYPDECSTIGQSSPRKKYHKVSWNLPDEFFSDDVFTPYEFML